MMLVFVLSLLLAARMS